MKKTIVFGLLLLTFCSCTKDGDDIYVEVDAPTLTIDQMRSDLITVTPDGNDVVFEWPHLEEGIMMDVKVLKDGMMWSEETLGNNVTSFVQKNLETKAKYAYLFRVTDGTRYSDGVWKTYTRPGAAAVTGLAVCQKEGASGYEAVLSWNPMTGIDEVPTVVEVAWTNGNETKTEEVDAHQNQMTFTGLQEGQTWEFTVTARNEEGSALPETTTLKVGKTAVAFVSFYPTPDELVANGDDDEASAWLWFHEQYPNSRFLYFGDITSADVLKDLRVLFYIRDIDTGNENDVWNQPEVVQNATPYIIEWYRNGGNMLLWQHACTYVGDLGRISKDLMMRNGHTIGTSKGFYGGGCWFMACYTNLAGRYYINYSTHPIYRNVAVNRDNSVTVKGSCWSEDHNCCFNDIPSSLTGMNDQSADTYRVLTEEYGIYPLATWDNSGMNESLRQLNVWEARQGNTEFKGTLLCMGNGGVEFCYNNPDGSPAVSARPMNNPYHGSVLQMAKNAIEYLKTR